MINFTPTKCFLGDALRVDNGHVEFTVPLAVGPRIIALGKLGGANIMFNDEHDEVNRDCSAIFGEGAMWHIYGGHRLWLSPEGEDTYYPDNEPIKVEKLDNGVILSPSEWKVIKVQPSIRLEFIGDNELKVTHTVINKGATRPLCLWALTVLKCGGKLELPLETRDTGLLANRNIVLWPYTDLRDERLDLYNAKLCIKSSVRATKPLKVGVYKKDIDATYTIGDTTFKKRYSGEGDYPDFCCNFETYTSSLIHEVESLSPIATVRKGDSVTHVEYWTVE